MPSQFAWAYLVNGPRFTIGIMTDDSVEQPADNNETQRASDEAKERLMRLRVWLNGLLAGGPSLAEAVKPWREGLPIYSGAAETLVQDLNEVPVDDATLIEQSLKAACHRLRERRKQAGEQLLDICEEESERRLTEVTEEVHACSRTGKEFTPLQVVLAARYIEGVITPEEYRSRR